MQQINETSHYSTIISSLNKEYRKTKIGKTISPNDIYLLDVVYNLLQGCCLELSDIEIKKLLKIYNTILHSSKIICNNNYQEVYQMSKKDKFIQAEKTDCNTIPIQPTISKIYYWQEVYTLNNSQITNLVDDTNYLVDKPSDTYENFEIGKNIDYTKVGKIVFLALESDNRDFIITDVLNNDVTHTFSLTYLPQLNATLFISDNNYAHGIMFFRFKKLPTELNQQIFNNIFNNIFA